MTDTKRFYWLKLKEDFFRQKEIKKLRRIAGGDTFTIIYLKMLLRSLKDGGKLYYEGIEENFVSELALDIDEDEDNTRITVAFLMANGILIQSQTDEYELVTSGEMTDSECDSAHRVRRLRAKRADNSQQALHCNGGVTEGNGDVTACNTDIEIEKELEKRDRYTAHSAVKVPRFDEFWAAYPRKVAKQNAYKSWQKVKPDEVDTILRDIRRRLDGEWKDTGIKYIPHPATYLNQRRWEDEPETTVEAEPAGPWYAGLTLEERQRREDEQAAKDREMLFGKE